MKIHNFIPISTSGTSSQKSGSISNPSLKPYPKDTFCLTSQCSFKGQPLYDVNVKKLKPISKRAELVPAQIVKMSPNDFMDKIEMKNIEKWSSLGSVYADIMAEMFFNDSAKSFFKKATSNNSNEYIAVKLLDEKAEDVLSIARVIKPKNLKTKNREKTLVVELIQSAPIAERKSGHNKYKGAGEIMMYGICKRAMELGCNQVKLSSSNDGFYEHIGMQHSYKMYPDGEFYVDPSKFEFNLEEMRAFTEATASKYGFV